MGVVEWIKKFKRKRFSFCTECGKPLRSKKSRADGVGPICSRKMNQQALLERQGQLRLL